MKFFQVDAFTDKSLSGNPAAVCFPEEVFSDEMLLRIAQENNSIWKTLGFSKENNR